MSTSYFLVCPFSGIVLHLFHKKFEFVFPIFWLWLTIFWTFTEILIIYEAQIPHNDVASENICEWGIVVRTMRMLSFEVINAEVLQYTSMIKDVGFLNNSINILDGRKRNLNKKSFSQTRVRWPHPLPQTCVRWPIVILSNVWCCNISVERL